VWPARLSIVYEPPAPFSLANTAVIAGVLAAVVILACAWVLRRRAPGAWIGSLVFLVLLAPTFGILTYSPVFAYDRYLHLPLMGIAYAAPGGHAGARARPGRQPCVRTVLAMMPPRHDWRVPRWCRAHLPSGRARWSLPGMAMAHNGLGATWSDAKSRRAIAAFERAAPDPARAQRTRT
jgi:hypothetical protein